MQFEHCPPGLGGSDCLDVTCNSTFVDPLLRSPIPSNAPSCPTCDDGFTGLNCNVCQGRDSCTKRQAQVHRGTTGVSSSSDVSGPLNLLGAGINNTLTCNNQPLAIDATFFGCKVNQPTLSALFPGSISLTGIKVVSTPNFTATGMSEWDAQANTSYMSLYLDGVEQFYCQATACHTANTTSPVKKGSASWGTEKWSCDSFACSCPNSTHICSNPTFPLGNIIDQLSGSFEFPCDYVDPNDENAKTQCTFSTAELNRFVGPQGLPLEECMFGQCVSQFDIEQSSQQQSLLAARHDGNSHLSGGVIAGLIILGLLNLLLFSLIGFGCWQRRKAQRKPRSGDKGAIGLQWTNVSYCVSSSVGEPKWRWESSAFPTALRKRFGAYRGKSADDLVELRDIHVQRSSTESLPEKKSKGKSVSKRDILHDVSSRALPGSLNYIIGPSGAGKSSLVDVLAGRSKKGTVQGVLTLLCNNSSASTPDSIEKKNDKAATIDAKVLFDQSRTVALVDQDDSACLPAYMTVHEALSFAVQVSMPENVSTHEREVIVDETIHTLGLYAVRHSRIGDSRSRGISGGERRRLSLAIAMVGRPRILIADECTSGLDAFSALHVVKALRRLASGSQNGTTVIATLHQPSSQIFDMADNVVLLSNGRSVFDGPPSAALGFCQRVGVPVPPGHNVGDHLLTYAFETQRSTPSQERNLSDDDNHSQRSATGLESQQKMDTDRIVEHKEILAAQQSTLNDDPTSHAVELPLLVRVPLSLNHGGGQPVTTFVTQLHALLLRSLLMTKRDMLGAMSHIVGASIISVFNGACLYQAKLDLGGFQNRVGSMFFVFILILFLDLSAIVGLSNTRLLMMRERSNGFHSPGSWVASHLLHDLLLLRAIPTTLIVSIMYWMVGLNHKASYFFQFLLIAVIYSWTIAVYNMALAALIEDMGTAILLAAVNVLFNIFTAGFIMSLHSMPAAVRWLRWLSPTKFALEAVASNELNGVQLVDTLGGVPIRTDVSLFSHSLFGFEDGSYYRNLIVLACGFLVSFGIVLFTAVWWRMRELR